MWLTDLLPDTNKVCPTCPTSKNKVGQPETLVYVGLSDLSDLSDQEKAKNNLSGESLHKEKEIAQVSYKNPESVRLGCKPSCEKGIAKSMSDKSYGENTFAMAGLPAWIRLAVSGEVLDDTKERRCASAQCGAVFIRQGWETDTVWNNKRYCSGQCWAGKPFILAAMAKEVI